MKLMEVWYTFAGSNILFYFVADGRIGFWELVKEIVKVKLENKDNSDIRVRDYKVADIEIIKGCLSIVL